MVEVFLEMSERVSVASVKDGVELYTHTAWATDENGTNFSLEYDKTKTYRGILENSPDPTPSRNPRAYTWTRWTGMDGDSIRFKGELDSVSNLPPKGEVGDTYFIQGYMWTWNGKQWQNMGKVKGEDGHDGVDGTSCVILSTGGTIFKNGEGSTTLTVKIYRGEAEIDTEGTQYEYKWEKWTEGQKEEWSAKGKSIDIDYNHVNVSTTFIVKVGSIAQGQITIVDLNDTIVSLREPTQKIPGTLWHNLNDNKTYVWTGIKWELTTPNTIVGANNKILNSNFTRGYNKWINSTYVLDDTIKHEESHSIFINVSEDSLDTNSVLKTIQYPCKANVPISAQCKCYIPNKGQQQSNFDFYVIFYNINRVAVGHVKKQIDIELKDMWQLIKLENTKTPAGTMYVEVLFNLVGKGKVYLTETQLEYSTSCSDYRMAAEDLLDYSNEIFNQVVDINEKVEDNAIIRTVTGSLELKELLGGKANIEDLNGLVTDEALKNETNNLKNHLDKVIGGLKLTDYITQSQLQQSMKDFLFNFTEGGGVNLLLNSLGLAPNNLGWTITNSVQPVENGDIYRLGFSSGWHFNSVTKVNYMRQTVSLNPNKEYTISFFIRKSAGVDFRVETYDGADISATRKDFTVNQSSSYNYEYMYFTVTPTSSTMTFVLSNQGEVGGSDVIITGLMLNQGNIPFAWQSHPTEMYNNNTKIDKNGVRVNRLDNGSVVGYTEMTPTQFAGYYRNPENNRMERTFALLGEYTLANKLVARDEINVGSLKIIKADNGKNVGVAFVALAKEFEVE